MAKNGNKGDNHRLGEIKNRSQAYNPKTKKFVEFDGSGKIINVKKTSGPFKGVRKV